MGNMHSYLVSRTLRALLLVSVAAMLALAMAGCGGDDDKSGSADTTSADGEYGGVSTETGEDAPANPSTAGQEPGKPADEAKEESENFNQPPPIQLKAGSVSGYRVSKPTAVVVRTQKEEDAMLDRLFSNGVKEELVVGTDFKDRQVVGVFLPKSPKGTQLSITEVYPAKSGKIRILATKMPRGKGCPTQGPAPRPYMIVETAKMSGQPELDLTTQRQSPC